MATKTAKIAIQMFALSCPECDDSVINPLTGSYDFGTSSYEMPAPGSKLECDSGHTVRMPKW